MLMKVWAFLLKDLKNNFEKKNQYFRKNNVTSFIISDCISLNGNHIILSGNGTILKSNNRWNTGMQNVTDTADAVCVKYFEVG